MADEATKVIQEEVEPLGLSKFSPTLFIGLGGSGIDIMNETKQRLVERWGAIPPIMQFACFDTAAIEKEKIMSKKNSLGPDEVVYIADADYANDILPNLDTRPYITEWLDTSRIPYSIDLGHGAGQSRPIGRLCFFWSIEAIKSKLEKSLRAARDGDNINKTINMGINVNQESGINVIIACSVCGGTGSGTFLDLAYVIRHLAGTNSNLKTTGYLILDNAFPYGDGITANLFAAVKELDHFMSNRKPRFKAQYSPTLSVDMERTPFDHCYLIDSMNQGGKNIKKEDLFRAASESILIRLGGRTLTGSASREVNTFEAEGFDPEVFMSENNDKMPIFKTFGCSFLRLPVPDLVDYSSNRLSAAITKALNAEGTEPERAETKAADFVRQSRIPSSDEAMYQILATINGKPLSISLSSNTFADTPAKNLLMELQSKMTSDAFQQIKATNLEAINENKERIVSEAKAEIENSVERILATPGEGVGFAINYLQALQDKNLIVRERENLAKLGRAKEQIDSLATEINSIRQDLSTRTNKLLVTDKSLKNLFTNLLSRQNNLLVLELQRSVRDAEDSIIKMLNGFAEDLLAKAEKSRANLKELNRRANSVVSEYENTPFTVNTSYSFNLLEPKQYGLIYDFELDEIPFATEGSACDAFIAGIKPGFLGLSAEEIEERVGGFARKAFSDLRKVNIEMFIKKHKEMSNADDIINSLGAFSLPLLSINTARLAAYGLPHRNNKLCVPVKENPDPKVNMLLQSIFAENYKTIPGENKELEGLELIQGDDETQITLYQERTEIPLLSVLTFRKCEAAYNYRIERRFKLHLRKEYADFDSVFVSDVDEKIVLKMALAEVFSLIEKDIYGKYVIARVVKDKKGNESISQISYSQSRELIQQTLQENKEAHDFIVQRINEELENRGKNAVKPMIDNYMENLDIIGPETQLNKIIYDQLEEYLDDIKPLV